MEEHSWTQAELREYMERTRQEIIEAMAAKFHKGGPMPTITVFAASPDEVDYAIEDARARDKANAENPTQPGAMPYKARPTVTGTADGKYGVLFRSETGQLVNVVYDPNEKDRMPVLNLDTEE